MGVTISRKIHAEPDSDLCFAHKELHRATKSHFSFECILKVNSIGGTLWKAKHKLTKKEIILVEIPKISVLNNRRTHQIVNELEVLKSINHPLLSNLRYAFHDPLKLFMGFDYLGGGTLAQHLKKRGCLNEFEAKFLVTCLLTVVEYLHNQNIIHGNITPDNLVFSSEGYLHLCDFKMAKMVEHRSETDLAYEDFQYDQDLSYSGIEYFDPPLTFLLAPEFLLKKNIAKSVDYYSIGLIAYEMMVGNNPLEGKGRKEIIKTLNSGGSIQIRKSELPEEWSFDAADFVNRLIQINPENRLGSLGFYQIKAHPWLKDFPWQKIEDKTLDIPFRPKNEKQYNREDRQNPGGKAKSHQDLREANEEERQSIRRSKVNFMMFDYDYYSDKEKKNLALSKSLENGELGIPTMMLGNLSKMLNAR